MDVGPNHLTASQPAAPALSEPSIPPAAMETWLPLLQESLAREGRFRWRLRGASMTPTLPPDCEVEIAPPGQHVPLGALIVFASGSSLVIHRLVHRSQTHWVAQGDARRQPDPRLAPNQVLGVVVAAYVDEARCWPRRLSRLAAWVWIARAHWLWLGRRVRRALG